MGGFFFLPLTPQQEGSIQRCHHCRTDHAEIPVAMRAKLTNAVSLNLGWPRQTLFIFCSED